jgi:hypothetical protein
LLAAKGSEVGGRGSKGRRVKGGWKRGEGYGKGKSGRRIIRKQNKKGKNGKEEKLKN